MNSILIKDINASNIVSFCKQAIEDYNELPVLQLTDEFAYVDWRVKYMHVETYVRDCRTLMNKPVALLEEFISSYEQSGDIVTQLYQDDSCT